MQHLEKQYIQYNIKQFKGGNQQLLKVLTNMFKSVNIYSRGDINEH